MDLCNVIRDDLGKTNYQIEGTKYGFFLKVSRKEYSEIPDLLEDFKASGYGLFYSGMLSPQTLDRIKKKESVIYWAKGELEILLRKYKNMAIRYFGI